MIISHRGNDNHKFKENTFLGLISSLSKSYIDGAECDIRITKDKKFVLNHGFSFNNKIIKYTNSKDLTLDKLDSLKNIKSKKIIFIEIKDNDENIINLIYKYFKKFKHLNLYFMTFYKDLAIKLKSKYPILKVGLISFTLKEISNLDFICLYYLNYKKTEKELFVWTVNKKDKIKKFISMGVNVITDKPYLIK